MDQKTEEIKIKGNHKRMRKGIGTGNVRITIPEYLLRIIDQEADYRKKTRSLVIAYLILSGIKAHTGEFLPPGDNHIKKLWRARYGKS